MCKWLALELVVALVFLSLVKASSDSSYGILVVEHEDKNLKNEHFCMVYYPSVYDVSENKSQSERYLVSLLKDLDGVNACKDGDDLSGLGLEGSFPIFSSNLSLANCSLWEKIENLQEYEVKGLLAEGNYGNKFNSSEFKFTVPFASLLEKDAKKRLLNIQENHPQSKFYLHRSDESFDKSALVIFAMAVGTVMVGSFWSGYAKQSLRLRKVRRRFVGDVCHHDDVGDKERVVEQAKGLEGEEEEEDISVRVSPVLILFFVCAMCGMLVLLFFFFNYLVYVIMVMFCIASALAMYSCLEPLVMMTYALPLPILRLPKMNLYICRLDLELRQLLLLILSISTTVVWFVFRKADWSWGLQDFLGILFSINMLKVLRLPSLKICSVLLGLLFVYDIFFVFITPLFMPGGKSVMVEVATGHSTDEQLPMVLKVPHLTPDPCYKFTYSLLGFGDILVPGLLMSFCHGFDLMVGTPCKIYWIISCVAYTLGLVATFISLYLMNSAQPALLYLVPFTLIPIYLVALCRGEFLAMWKGDSQDDQEMEEEEDQCSNHEEAEGSTPESDK
jgi:signal peptide peptidase-like protein 2B